MSNSILRPFLGKWLDEKPRKINRQTVSLIFLVLLALVSFVYVNYFQLANRSSANLSCPLATSPDKVHGKVVITPTNSEYIYDCSGVDVVIASDGEVVVGSYVNGDGSITGDYGAQIVFNNLTIESGGRITTDAQGYKPGESDGGSGSAIASTDNVGGSGGGYGGAGGEGRSNGLTLPGKAGEIFGSIYNPILLGGAGGDSSATKGGNGGGAVRIDVNGTLTLDGVISSNGGNGNLSTDNTTSSGGGAGGSIWINAKSINGSGSVTANGGSAVNATYEGGGGGGGRIIVECTSSISFTGSVLANGGDGTQDGQTGSIIGPGCIPNTPTVAKVYEGNGNNTRLVPQAGYTTNTSVTIMSDMLDPNTNATVRLQVEVRGIGEDFTGVPTNTQAAYVNNPKACTGISDCGSVTISGLTSGKQYKYRIRTTNSTNVSSEWLDVGSNGSNADFTISGAAASFIKTAGDNQTGEVGKQVATTLKAQLVDANSFPIPVQAVTWQVMTGSGSLINKTTTTDDNGYITTDWILGTVSGTNNNTVKISKSGISDFKTFTASANAGPLSSFNISVPSLVVTGNSFSITINAVDQYNNSVNSNDLINLKPVNADGGSVSGTLLPANIQLSSGTGTVSNATYSDVGVVKISATDNTDTSISKNSTSILFVNSTGTCPDVDIDTNTTWNASGAPNGVYDCRGLGTFTVRSGYTLTLVSLDSGDKVYTNDYGVTILADSFNIESGATITANAYGYLAGHGPGNPNAMYIGASYGGYGSTSGGSSGVKPYGSVFEPSSLGSAGGDGSRFSTGGGAIKFVASDSFTNNGTISSNGSMSPSGWSGGGSGGSIWIDTVNIAGTGTITANGGKGDQNGGGSGGRVAVYYKNNNDFVFTNIQTVGNNGGWGGYYGASGTVYVEQKNVDASQQGWLIVNNNNYTGSNYAGLTEADYAFNKITMKKLGCLAVLGNNSTLQLKSASTIDGDTTMSKLRVDGTFNYTGGGTLLINGVDLEIKGEITGVVDFTLGDGLAGGMRLYANTWAHNNSYQYTFGEVNIGALGTLSLVSYDSGDTTYTNDYGLTLYADNINVQSGGTVTSTGYGYQAAHGPGNPNAMYVGASYGGYGSTQSGSSGKAPYGSAYQPVSLGSAGGNGDRYSTGGGSMKLVVNGTLTVNGTVSSNGSPNHSGWSGGGSGGSIWIDTNTINGTGVIQTNGGIGDQNGGGSGGRVAVYYSNSGSTYNFTTIQSRGCNGGWGGYYGGPGTVYVEQKDVDVNHQGWLLVNNNNYTGGNYAGLEEGYYVFKKISLKNLGYLAILGQNSTFQLSSADAIDGDSTKSKLRTDGTFSYIGSGTLMINGIDLEIKGEISGVTDFTLGNTLAGGMKLYANTWAHNSTNQYTFGNITIGSAGTMTLSSYDNGDSNYTNDYGVTVNASNINVASGGVITSTGLGYLAGHGPGNPNAMYVGASYGGYGGTQSSGNGISPYGSVYTPDRLGSAAGNTDRYSYGGGSIKLNVSGDLVINGSLNSDGSPNHSGWSGGGSGGSIWIDTNNLSGSGIISANGGIGDQYGGGSGGRVAVYYQNSTYDFNTIQSRGNNAGWGGVYGGPGTVYIERKGVDTNHQGWLLVNNNSYSGNNYAGLVEDTYVFSKLSLKKNGYLAVLGQNSVVQLTSANTIDGDSSMPNLRVEGTFEYTGTGALQLDGIDLEIKGEISGVEDFNLGSALAGGMTLYANTWAHNKSNQYDFGDINIGPLGVMTLISYDNGDTDYTNDYGVTIASDNLNVQTGGLITATAKGYLATHGPGNNSAMYVGASYGGYGSTQGGSSNVAPYGSVYEPDMLGSAAGNGDRYSYGGGSIKLVVRDDFTNNGTVSSNGSTTPGGWSGGASGGSVWVDTNTIGGTGTITANGGNGDQNGGGSGGRIAVYYTTSNSYDFELIHAFGDDAGWGGAYGGPGTVYVEQKGVDTPHQGWLIINNNNQAGGNYAGLVSDSYKFSKITLKKLGHVEVMGNDSTMNVDSDALFYGDSSRPKLKVDGTFAYTGDPDFDISGISLEIRGEIQGVTNINIGNSLAAGLILYANTWAHNNTNQYTFSNINVGQYGLVSLNSYDNGDTDYSNDYGVTITADNVNIASGGIITATGLGYNATHGPGNINACYVGASYGGYGSTKANTYDAPTYGNLYKPTDLGSAAGTSDRYSTGGGSIKLVVNNTLSNSGTISSNGSASPGGWSGGAAGGSIWIDTINISGSGLITANGGIGDQLGGGGGGRVAVYYKNNDGTFSANNVQAYGNNGNWGGLYGGPGTVYLEDTSTDRASGGSLYIKNNGNSGRAMNFAAKDWTFNDVNIDKNITVWVESDMDNDRGVLFDLTGDFTLGSGSSILGDGAGYQGSSGPAKGTDGTLQNGGGGGGHGGSGGNGESSDGITLTLGGEKNGDQIYPKSLGSGGGAGGSGGAGGAGGGAFAVLTPSGSITIVGNISMNGTDGKVGSPGGGGGAGGSVLLRANSSNISGNISATGGAGGDSTFDGGGGGGGIVSIIRENGIFNVTGNVNVVNGGSTGGQLGQEGIYSGIITIPQIELNDQTTTDDEQIPVGGMISDNEVKLIASVYDSGATQDNPDNLVANFEVMNINDDFTGSDLITSDEISVNGDTNKEVSVLVNSNLVSGESYMWRARVVNLSTGIAGDWSYYGDNGDSADFTISSMSSFTVTPSKTSVYAGEKVALTVSAYDTLNKPYQDYDGTILFTVDPETDPLTTLPSNYSFSDEDKGRHIFTDGLVFYTPGTYVINVTDSLNPEIKGTTTEITVTAAPVTTVVVDNNVTDNSVTDNTIVTATPQATDCSSNPNQASCQKKVVISNVTNQVETKDLLVNICWDTNIATVGSVTYGKTILSDATDVSDEYSMRHCVTIPDLEANTNYNYQIKVSSEAGNQSTYDGNFTVGKAEKTDAGYCIKINNYSFNANSDLLLNYQTAYKAKCTVTYGYLDKGNELLKDVESTSKSIHNSAFSLAKLESSDDISYNIACTLDYSDDLPDNVQTCNLSGVVQNGKIAVYLPETGSESSVGNMIHNVVTTVANVVPIVTVPIIIGSVSGIAFQYPQIMYYGIFWLKRRRKNKVWGLVFDDATKTAIPFAVIRLYDAFENKLIREEVANIEGKYNFLVTKGKYTLVVEHSDYQQVKKQITIYEKESQIAEEIALIKKAKSEAVKLKLVNNVKVIVQKNNDYIVALGFLITLIACILSPVWYNFVVLSLYVLQELLLIRTKAIRWAKVRDLKDNKGIAGAFVRIFDPVQQRQLEVTLTDGQGRYKFMVSDGRYLAGVYKQGWDIDTKTNKTVVSENQKMVWINVKAGVTQTNIMVREQNTGV